MEGVEAQRQEFDNAVSDMYVSLCADVVVVVVLI
jgi:hypothetical protein